MAQLRNCEEEEVDEVEEEKNEKRRAVQKAKAKVKSGSCVANVTRWPQACYVHIPERGGLTPSGAPSCQFCGLQDAVLARDWCEKSGRRRRDPFMVQGCKPGLVASPPATCCGSSVKSWQTRLHGFHRLKSTQHHSAL
ncbi:hypothetical protein MAA_10774 [Metarhizium robertsii ARSEF 23]|uniref:Uncharacterized protein n=1 Tax=Metarhizium robertsii (strain ARSEF 23 / ATCC MYA-3075) TaxID=655844 RepID=A0A0B2XJ73_METRA|nr:uncharacterized protein MAA_10774 [Metarhizium robertsii ARSEF 23]KHO11532.1 hypothetical protein MAA_10774 [Metarhizium robertsii ARSEF 23]